MSDVSKLLSSLEDKVKEQVGREWDDPQDAEYVYQNMTVPQLLDMLSYMFGDKA